MANISECGDDDQLDPRIKGELEALNSAAESINKLENEIQKARSLFKKHKAECANNLKALSHKIGKKLVAQAVPYYEIIKKLNKLQSEAQKVASRFQKASSVHKAAQETVSLAEQQLVTEDGSKLAFDAAWQEMLNHANLRFMEAEKEKRSCEEEHKRCSDECSKLQFRLIAMKKDIAKAIEKSKPFYDLKESSERKLQVEKQNAEDLQLALVCSKQKYKLSLISLEQISEEIHMQRDHSKLPRRTPGVGAESDACSEFSELLSANLDFISDTSSQVSRDDLTSEFYLDEAWTSNRDDVGGSGKVLDGFFNKVSKRFNRSSSLGNISAGLTLQLQTPAKEMTLNRMNSNPTSESVGTAVASARDGTVEGAEQTPGEFKDVARRREREASEGQLPKTYTSTVFLPISYPIDKARHEVGKVGFMATGMESYSSNVKLDSPKVSGGDHPKPSSFRAGLQNFRKFSVQKMAVSSKNKPADNPIHHFLRTKSFQIDKNADLQYSLEMNRKESF